MLSVLLTAMLAWWKHNLICTFLCLLGTSSQELLTARDPGKGLCK